MKTLTDSQVLAAVQAEINSATSIADVTRIARVTLKRVRIERVACGYRLTEGK